ncbi:transcriptional repressor [Rhodophyticola sp. CCM32]|uniref:transcriptional repressor n=1 Tax=Rhodophyticola sp. CCM32 TaxID=2916397 RepID=UPI00107FA8C9|nr:transcriptional repressor [Rhodophyticola sp. CCM32]QBY00479.1 transcriptional repressor [Rhodophyticola sp. CCM32]
MTVGFETHDHKACIDDMTAVAEAYCTRNKLKFTPTRRRVLEILLEEHKAIGAYDILDHLVREGRGSQPPIAYRALDFLVKHGFVHKIERLNAYIACAHPHENHSPAFMICRVCDSVAEACSVPSKGILGQAARDVGFRIERTVVEAEGVCPKCADVAGVA